MRKILGLLFAIVFLSSFIQPAFSANGWTETQPAGDTTQNWLTSSMSDDGETILIGASDRLYISINGGETWAEEQPAGDTDNIWKTVSVSGDGQTLIAGAEFGRLYISTDGGDNFVETQPLGDTTSRWRSSGISDNGEVIYVGTDRSGGFLSTNGGDTWNLEMPHVEEDGVFFSAAVSGDGLTILLGDFDTNLLYVTRNQGGTWIEAPIGEENQTFEAAAVSDNGEVMLAGQSDGRLYISVNGGADWSEVRPNGNDETANWQEVALSDDGSVMLAVNNTDLFFSEDSGATWFLSDPVEDFSGGRALAMNSNASNNLVASSRAYLSGDLMGTPASEPTPEPTPTPSPTPSSSSESSNSPGTSVTTPSCQDRMPVGMSDLFQINRTGTTAVLYFTPINDQVEKYHVVYGYIANDARFGHIGAQVSVESNTGVQSITINHLDPAARYWFQVMPVNGCAVGERSNWLEAKPVTGTSTSIFYRWF